MAMAEVPHAAGAAGSAHTERGSAWAGWSAFAGLVLIMVGISHLVTGLAVVLTPSYALAEPGRMLVIPSFGVWGWIHLIAGVIVAVVGVGVMLDQAWARAAGVVLAGISAIINLGFLAAYPVWSLVLIVLDVVVIYGLTVHGARLVAAGK
jgi:hypothetical protein